MCGPFSSFHSLDLIFSTGTHGSVSSAPVPKWSYKNPYLYIIFSISSLVTSRGSVLKLANRWSKKPFSKRPRTQSFFFFFLFVYLFIILKETLHLRLAFDLQKSWKDNTESSCAAHTQFPLILIRVCETLFSLLTCPLVWNSSPSWQGRLLPAKC